ncbi:outer membrane protein transport protein [Flavobacterium sp.]|uniref:OmpP1/FadL family transporter n=1 Tax=Flavobacterium sp. TaxID=239 RepID=UPI00261C065E|nr:outer membrane protein transport protein [Flavobacterium sp.]
MKKIFAIAIATLAISSIQAQDINDALRYGQTDLNGTARFRAMGGAFGALGGDFSSLNVNPAGSVIFANNQVGLTLSNFNIKNNSNYFGNKTSENDNSFDLNQAGAVFIFENGSAKSDWKKFAIAVNYENARNLDNSLFSSGVNRQNSIDSYFLSYANGVPFGNLNNFNYEELFFNEQQAYLGYNSYIIDPLNTTNNNVEYYTNIAGGGNYYQENAIESTGYNGKLTFNASTQYKDKFSFGINLNSHFIDYKQSTSFFEANDNPKYTIGSTVDRVRFNNQLYTYGTGFSFNIGTIFKPTKEVRLGLAYESPTWYKLNDELSQQVVTSGYGLNPAQDNTLYSTQVTDPNVTMIFQPYKLQTPGKWTGSFAYIFGKKGLISLDYSMKDYSNMEYRPQNDFPNENRSMSNLLTTSSEVRVGTEYKIKKWSLRGGYRWEQSPYKNGNAIGDLTGYSGGLGYNFGSTKVDLAYAHAKRNYNLQFFSQGLVDPARIENITDNVTLTLIFEL